MMPYRLFSVITMSFWGKIGQSIKKGTENISIEIKRKQEIIQTKRLILNRFEMADLKKICNSYGIGEPSSYEINQFTGERYKRTVTRNHYIDRIINRLTLDQIKIFSEKNGIKIWDIVKGKEPTKQVSKTKEHEPKSLTMEMEGQGEFDSILEAIKENFDPEDVRDEEDFEKQLVQFLKIKYPERIRRQLNTPKGKIDLVIDDKYAIELKIADGKGKLRDLVGQLVFYKKEFNDLAVVILDVHRMPLSEIKEYTDEYEKQGVKTLILSGVLRRRKGKSKQINIKIN